MGGIPWQIYANASLSVYVGTLLRKIHIHTDQLLYIPKVTSFAHQDILFYLHFIDFAITVVLILPPCPFHPALPTPSGNPSNLVHVNRSCVCNFFGYSLSLLYFTSTGLFFTYLYYLIPSPLTLSPTVPSHLFIFNLWHFNYDVPWGGPLPIHHVWDSFCFLDLHVHFLHQVREVFFH